MLLLRRYSGREVGVAGGQRLQWDGETRGGRGGGKMAWSS